MNSDLIDACKSGNAEQVNNLLTTGTDPNQTDDNGGSPLFWALFSGYLKIVKLLLKAGADPNQSDVTRYYTPLFWASFKGYLEIVELLLKAGADPNKANNNGAAPLFWASRNGHLEMVKLLKSYKNKISSLSLLCLRAIYRNQINTDNIPSVILEWDFYQ